MEELTLTKNSKLKGKVYNSRPLLHQRGACIKLGSFQAGDEDLVLLIGGERSETDICTYPEAGKKLVIQIDKEGGLLHTSPLFNRHNSFYTFVHHYIHIF